MDSYNMITDKHLARLTKTQLASMYNDAVETIWLLNHRIYELREENEALWESYEEVCDKLYG